MVKYLRCLMDKAMSGEAMTLGVIHKITNKQVEISLS